MFRINQIAAVLVLFSAAGCASMPTSTEAASQASVKAGETTFVRVPSGHGQFSVIAYRNPGEDVCPRCEAIASKYFETGSLERSVCDKCGATIAVVRGEAVTVR